MSSFSSLDKMADWDEKILQEQARQEKRAQDRQDCRMYLRMAFETTLAVGLVVVVTTIVLATNSALKCCEPSATRPPRTVDLAALSHISSPDARALVAFSGYIKFITQENSDVQPNATRLGRLSHSIHGQDANNFLYLPLNLTNVTLGPLEPVSGVNNNNNKYQLLNLTTDCALLSLRLELLGANSTLRVATINLEPSGQHSGYVEPSVVRSTAIALGASQRYVCPFAQEYAVHLLAPSGHKTRMLSLVLTALEFQVDQTARDRAVHFSKPAHYCFEPGAPRGSEQQAHQTTTTTTKRR